MDKVTDKNIAEFMKAINRDAFIEVEKIQRQLSNFSEQQIKAAKEEIKEDTQRDKDYQINKMRTETNIKISKIFGEMRSELIQKRDSYTKEVFDCVAEKLRAFTATPDYAKLLMKSASEISDVLKDGKLTFFLRKEDMQYADRLVSGLERACEVKADDSIQIGGLKAECANAVADDTLENRLLEQMDWYMMQSQLSVVESY